MYENRIKNDKKIFWKSPLFMTNEEIQSRKIPNNILYDFPTPLSAGFPLSQEIKKEQEFQKLFIMWLFTIPFLYTY